MKSKNIIFPTIVLLVILSACIKLKEPYPIINYYSLSYSPLNLEKHFNVNGSILIRNFSIANEYETDFILVHLDNNKIQRYYYHRWLSKFNDMSTEMVAKHISDKEIYTDGVITGSSMIIPDYILEGKVLDLNTYNSSKGESFISLSINARFIARNSQNSEYDIIFNKSYVQQINRPNNSVENIAEAYSKALSLISQMIIVDMGNNLNIISDE